MNTDDYIAAFGADAIDLIDIFVYDADGRVWLCNVGEIQ